jgi:hypothetical protein
LETKLSKTGPTEEKRRGHGAWRTVTPVDDEDLKGTQEPKYVRSKQGETQPGMTERHGQVASTPALYSEGLIFNSR